MKVYAHLRELRDIQTPVVTIGNFDGVHRGHAVLVQTVCAESRKKGGTPTVFTFHPHPLTVVNPYMKIEQITPLPDKLAILESMGVAAAVVLKFDDAFSRITPEDFIANYLVEGLGLRTIVIGYDFSFGRDRKGTITMFREQGAQHGFEVIVVDPLLDGGRVVSSTRIRSFLKEGNIREAAQFLGRPYVVKGMVSRGRNMGRMIGFPTANLLIKDYLIPRKGVYAARVTVAGKQYKAVLSIGAPVTFNINESAFEVHILDFDGDIYGSEMVVEFVERLRGIEKFKDADGLKRQIVCDIDNARNILI